MDNEIIKENNPEKTKKRLRSRQLIRRLSSTLILIAVGTVLISIFLGTVQARSALKKQQDNNSLALNEVVTILNKNKAYTDSLVDTYDDGNWKMLDDIRALFSNGLFENILKNDASVRSQIFQELSSSSGVSYLYLLDMDGKIVMCADQQLYGINPAVRGYLTQENINDLLKAAGQGDEAEPVLVKNRFGTFYFYAREFEYNNVRYALVLGEDCWVVNKSISSLSDVSTVLSRMGVINDGFLFAVSSRENVFLYYKNGDDFLTGQDAFKTGLTRDVMKDGYQGRQSILGEDYYCTSRVLDDTVIIAAARSETVLSHDRYVLIWSIIGFVLVMLLCMTYAIIVGNDFVRNGTHMDRVIVYGEETNPVYMNKSVLKKVFPLMLLGILTVYGISFYSQTLLEISEGVDKSNVILQEVNGRYEESMESRGVIVDYYTSRFLSSARLVRFYLEETPEVFNEPSEYYHTIYDKNGIKQYLNDDEGNPLKSVANSKLLQRLCDENNIKAIYLFDENGHTIATKTANWFFSVSNDPNDQSYPFRQILEGKAESYLQSAMTDDLGEEAQFFGIVLHYYTKTDASGNTVYVSRYEFEEACGALGVSGVRTAGGITKHTSLMQIQLDVDLIDTILMSTSAEAVLSTEMLSGGAIVMFDTSREHLCVYSPVKASIGLSAGELGISPNAFTGLDYFGFLRVNGKSYFTLFRYIDDYFIATAIPQESMFTSRAKISLITAGVSLVLIAFLLLAVTLITGEENEMYEKMIREYEDEDPDSSFFSIILPSGRSASTETAHMRWDNRRIPWNERTPEMKIGIIIGGILSLVILYIFIAAVKINTRADSDSIVRYIFSGAWDKAPNIFALTACFLVLILTAIVLELFRIPIRLITVLLGTRGETLGHLLLSIIKYGGTIGSLFYCLYLLGIDTGSLLASASILSLVIGLGSQSLIKDIIAGIFIVFEGEFRVGDIVTINNFRGTVTDIGLRTTKIVGDGNVKIFNNSEISGVLNMTKETSVASAAIGVEYGQDLEYVEEVLERELPLLKLNNKKILEGPTNLGVTELAERRLLVTVTARCSEQNIREVNRYLNKSLLQIFYRNGIKVPNQNMALVKKEPAAGAENAEKK
ncbi:MAG: mechanosensitive ion channel family protein [Erysipelotrichaceae bacterium]|nr:mechanosensitive ion channel family protein [Erysipelotrichaceae bacterium]